jgi:glucose-6-phosphate dehydrogenase assembly protein OpcA
VEAAVSTTPTGPSGSDRLDTFEKGGAIEVPVAKIETELAALWRQAVQKSGRKNPVTRACLWNLILRVDSEPRFVEAKKLVDDISAQVPARVIVLHVEDQAPEAPVRAWVEANWRHSGHGDSGSDEVTLWAAGKSVARLPSLVRALRVTDLPTAMLWWGPPPGGHAPARDMLDEIDRLIVDTRKLPSEQGMSQFLEIADARPDLDLVDCAWLGVRPLRGLLAGMFDPPHDPRKLAVLDRVRVISGVTGCQSRALLALGWLASRLGWKDYRKLPDAPGLRRWKAIRPGPGAGEITLELETRTGGASHGVVGLELQAGDEKWIAAREQGRIDVHGPGCQPRVQPVRQHSDAELVVSALGPRGRDAIFKDSLREAVRLVGAK